MEITIKIGDGSSTSYVISNPDIAAAIRSLIQADALANKLSKTNNNSSQPSNSEDQHAEKEHLKGDTTNLKRKCQEQVLDHTESEVDNLNGTFHTEEDSNPDNDVQLSIELENQKLNSSTLKFQNSNVVETLQFTASLKNEQENQKLKYRHDLDPNQITQEQHLLSIKDELDTSVSEVENEDANEKDSSCQADQRSTPDPREEPSISIKDELDPLEVENQESATLAGPKDQNSYLDTREQPSSSNQDELDSYTAPKSSILFGILKVKREVSPPCEEPNINMYVNCSKNPESQSHLEYSSPTAEPNTTSVFQLDPLCQTGGQNELENQPETYFLSRNSFSGFSQSNLVAAASTNASQEFVNFNQVFEETDQSFVDKILLNKRKKPRLESSSNLVDVTFVSVDLDKLSQHNDVVEICSPDKLSTSVNDITNDNFQSLFNAKVFLKDIQKTIDNAASFVDSRPNLMTESPFTDSCSFPKNGKSNSKIVKSFICNECRMLFQKKSDLVKHMNYVHRGQEFPFKCKHCGDMFSLLRQLQIHLDVNHLESSPPLKCDMCDNTFKLIHQLQEHKRSRHSNKKKASPKCVECNKIFQSESSLNQHKLEHAKSNFSKKLNGNVASNKSDIKRVKKLRKILPKLPSPSKSADQQKEKFLCVRCGKELESKIELTVHMKLHQKTKKDNFKCQICHEYFNTKQAKTQHVAATHKVAKPEFTCSVCKKSFAKLLWLQKHVEKVHQSLFDDTDEDEH